MAERDPLTGALNRRSFNAALASSIRDSDTLARIGGDEFALVAPGAGHHAARQLVDALDRAIRQAEMPAGVGAVNATFGWAIAPDDGREPEALLLRADERY